MYLNVRILKAVPSWCDFQYLSLDELRQGKQMNFHFFYFQSPSEIDSTHFNYVKGSIYFLRSYNKYVSQEIFLYFTLFWKTYISVLANYLGKHQKARVTIYSMVQKDFHLFTIQFQLRPICSS